MAALQGGRLGDAERLYRKVLKTESKHFPALVMLGLVCAQQGRLGEAEGLLRMALTVQPGDPGAQFNHANVLLAMQRHDEAFGAFGRALALHPAIPEAHLNRGGILMMRQQPRDAIACFDAALQIDPRYAEAHCNRGNALEALGRPDEALASYDRALALNPQQPEFHASRANLLHRLRQNEEALAALAKAIALQPRHPGLHLNRANILLDLKRFDEAFAAYDQAFRLDPNLDYLEGDRFFAKMMICDWTDLAAENAHLVAGVAAARPVSRPFAFLTAQAPAAAQIQCANMFADRDYPARPPLWRGERYDHQRIRIAYLSADYREHPVAILLAGLFERHDRSRFETMAVSFGAAGNSPMRQRLMGAFDRFLDVHDKSDGDVAQLLRDMEIDIAVDLMGPTQNARPGILAHRPAPVQVLYLGYAGSSGAPYVDYLLADRVVIPEAERELFRERIVYLPDSFMGADSSRAIAAATPTRAEEGLPPSGFVFCAFNNSYKLSPLIFDVWMTLLNEVPGSVLWLSGSNESAERRLRAAAQARGIAPERLVFAGRVARNEDHLARHRLADLYLDTLPINAHSTANDALWAGLPVLTCRGGTFGSRVAASLLTAVGLSDLITDNLADYTALALKLARDPDLLSSLRGTLAANRNRSPLFDTARFTRHIEAAYLTMWQRAQRGEPPSPFSVPPRE